VANTHFKNRHYERIWIACFWDGFTPFYAIPSGSGKIKGNSKGFGPRTAGEWIQGQIVINGIKEKDVVLEVASKLF